MSEQTEIEKIIDSFERELEEIEKNAIEINLSHVYYNSEIEWNGLVMFKLFDLFVQMLFPNNNVERIPLPADTPSDKYHIILRDVVNKLRNCRNIVVIREYDTLYYCVE